MTRDAVTLPTPAPSSLVRVLLSMVQRDLRLSLKRRADTAGGLMFFALVASLFPLAVGPEPQLLARMAGGVIWVAALLASMLSMPRLFNDDHQDGCLEQYLLSSAPLSLVVAAKITAHWLMSGALLVLMAPVLGLQYGLPERSLWVLAASLALGTPLLSLLGAIGAALTLGLRGGGMLLALLVLPLCMPVLIFGAGAVQAEQSGLNPWPHLALLAALLALALPLAPWAAAGALRIATE